MSGWRTWGFVARCGLAQMAIGAVAALMTSTLNRVMVVELALPATVPALLVALHFAVQTSRSRFGFLSDRLERRSPLVIAGATALSVGGLIAALAVSLSATSRGAGLAVSVVAFILIGLGMSASGTALLALVAERVAPAQRGGAAALLWIMMIFGIAVTAGASGAALDPFSMDRLVMVSAVVGGIAVTLSLVAVWGIEDRWPTQSRSATSASDAVPFRDAWRQVMHEPATVRFALFVLVSMLAYSMQDLILEPFAGRVFGMTPGQSTQLSGAQHAGVMLGMLVAAPLSARLGTLRGWAAAGCLASAIALASLALLPPTATTGMVRVVVFGLGASNGVFAVGALGAMMGMTAGPNGEGVGLRLGVYGAAQAVAYGVGGSIGGMMSDVSIAVVGSPRAGYGAVFAVEASLFVIASWMAARIATVSAAHHVPAATRSDVAWAYRQ